LVEFFLFHPHHEVVPREPGIVDEDVDSAESVVDALDQRLDIFRRSDVALEDLASRPGSPRILRNGPGGFVVRPV
jgi:hypothetical protein